ncbi:unnamed protein product [Trichogramma brassicae]|uniref:BTB domain-containing protein n=1 Tax=Trichogramma brassicae TaxID=86971 RepID=A0A6H5IS94_9HYME|nr:unnamed protein product [Trichogramma brassicae]
MRLTLRESKGQSRVKSSEGEPRGRIRSCCDLLNAPETMTQEEISTCTGLGISNCGCDAATHFVPARRRLPFASPKPSKEWQEAELDDELLLPPRQRQHKTVVYFGDSARRSKPSSKPTTKSDDPNSLVNNNNKGECRARATDAASIVLGLKPSRKQVMLILGDHANVVTPSDYAPPRPANEADWSFVQHWRVKGYRPRGSFGTRNSSSSDENRSSGHASMSDPGDRTSSSQGQPPPSLSSSSTPSMSNSSLLVPLTQDTSSGPPRPQRPPWKGSGLEDVRLAVQRLSLVPSSSSSSCSSSSSSSCSPYSSSLRPHSAKESRLARHTSAETLLSVAATSAADDEFVWLEARSRLVELLRPPWDQRDVLRLLRHGSRTAPDSEPLLSRLAPDALPRLSYLAQRGLVRLGREARRLSQPLGLCGRQQILGALRIVLCPRLADSCAKACLRAAAMFAATPPSSEQLRQPRGLRAGLQLRVGRFAAWMLGARLGRMVLDQAALYLTAALENLLEELLLLLRANDATTASELDRLLASSPEFAGLLQPWSHLAPGPKPPRADCCEPEALRATCVGSVRQLRHLLARLEPLYPLPLTFEALRALHYYMHCSQLESAGDADVELEHERAYETLPGLGEWLRVASGHAEQRNSRFVDANDIGQAARLLLAGVDFPVRGLAESSSCLDYRDDEPESAERVLRRLSLEAAFKLLTSGRPKLISLASALLPSPAGLDALNERGLTALMLACLEADEQAVRALLEAGADPNVETPPGGGGGGGQLSSETQHWTALTYAALKGHCAIAKMLLDRGASVEGGARPSEDESTVTPLQAAAASGEARLVSLLLAHGAQPFLSTLQQDSFGYSASYAGNCSSSAVSVAAAHGQRDVLRQLLSHPLNFSTRRNEKQVLSLEEILAEDEQQQQQQQQQSQDSSGELPMRFSKAQLKVLQEAMYQSAENEHLDVTMDLRSLGVTWSLHCWMQTLATAHEAQLDALVDRLLQDFMRVFLDDCSNYFVDDCLPLLCDIFRFSEESTILLLADIFCACYGWEPIEPIQAGGASFASDSRIDSKFVNNPELSDVQFRILLVTSSPRFRHLFDSTSNNQATATTPIIQINDIRYHIFQLVMEFLYHGRITGRQVNHNDLMELMAAANFFQLDGLLRFCEIETTKILDLDNVVSIYIHAEIYNAVRLLEYCQGFLLQNFVTLLTCNESVKRLLFSKKLPNHDVLSGLLATLQRRVRAKRP